MPLIHTNLSSKFIAHIDSYRHHFKFNSRTEAIRDLMLKQFEAMGNPLTDDEIMPSVGRPSVNSKKEPYVFVGKQEEEIEDRSKFFESFKDLNDA